MASLCKVYQKEDKRKTLLTITSEELLMRLASILLVLTFVVFSIGCATTTPPVEHEVYQPPAPVADEPVPVVSPAPIPAPQPAENEASGPSFPDDINRLIPSSSLRWRKLDLAAPPNSDGDNRYSGIEYHAYYKLTSPSEQRAADAAVRFTKLHSDEADDMYLDAHSAVRVPTRSALFVFGKMMPSNVSIPAMRMARTSYL